MPSKTPAKAATAPALPTKAATKATKTEPKQMDVAKPGATAPPATSKPVIVGHKPMVTDPMVQNRTQGEAKPSPAERPIVSSRVKKLEPLSTDLKTDTTDEAKAAVTPVTTAAVSNTSSSTGSETPKKTEPTAQATKSAKNTEQTPVSKMTDTMSIEQETSASTTEQKSKTAATEAAKKQQADADREAKSKELISSKKYYLKIDDGKSGSVKTFIITVAVILLVGLILLAVANDAGWIDLGLEMPFDFIK